MFIVSNLHEVVRLFSNNCNSLFSMTTAEEEVEIQAGAEIGTAKTLPKSTALQRGLLEVLERKKSGDLPCPSECK